jgi:hypothetical protein
MVALAFYLCFAPPSRDAEPVPPSAHHILPKQKAPLVQGRKGQPSVVPPWFDDRIANPENPRPIVALWQPSNKGPRANGRTRRGLSGIRSSVDPLDSQATFGGGHCEGSQPPGRAGTLFSSRNRFARADPAYSSCSPSFLMQFVTTLYHVAVPMSTMMTHDSRTHALSPTLCRSHLPQARQIHPRCLDTQPGLL